MAPLFKWEQIGVREEGDLEMVVHVEAGQCL
jgi:hypothetical protein